MRYIVTKVEKPVTGMGSLFGLPSSKTINIAHDSIFDTVEEAVEVINGFEEALNDKAELAWKATSDNERETMNAKFDKGAVYESEVYMVIPVETVLTVSSLPKHRREN